MKSIEIIGLIASVLIVFSMVFKTTNYKGTIAMRIINGIGSIFFTIYGFYPNTVGASYEPNALATGIANAALFILNAIYLIIEIRQHKKPNDIYKLDLYEEEVLFLYEQLKSGKPHMAITETRLKEIIDKNPEFKNWEERIKRIEDESNS